MLNVIVRIHLCVIQPLFLDTEQQNGKAGALFLWNPVAGRTNAVGMPEATHPS
jgi:sulfate adenylyltransferase subunit 1 (EFTu-like GTPase family)